MDIRSMHYDFKQKLNKIDSQQYRNLRVPEIDWKLNEGLELFVKSIAEPRVPNHLGFEKNQRTIDDIRTLVIDGEGLQISSIAGTTNYYVDLPCDYLFYLSADLEITNSNCGTKQAIAILQKHDDRHEESPFDCSSFEWGEINIRFYEEGIKIFTDGTFTIDKFSINYIKQHAYIHAAQDFLPGGTYNLPDGTPLIESKSCELPGHTHREIVDIAVLIATGEMQIPDYQIKKQKISLNQI